MTCIQILAKAKQKHQSLKIWPTAFLFMLWHEELVFQCSNMLVPESVPLPELKNKNHPIILKWRYLN